MYLTRFSREGIDGNKYYYEAPYNTENPSIQLSNCTCFSQGRGQELNLSDAKAIGSNAIGTFGNAKTWYAKSSLPKGQEIKEGCIVVYDGNYGHVLVVEKILERYSDTHCLCIISQSNYVEDRSKNNPNYYQTLKYDIEMGVKTQGVGLIPIGCLYPNQDDKRVSRDESKHQVEITYDKLRARTDLMEWHKGLYIPTGIYNVIKKERNEIDGVEYDVVKLDKNVWCALVDDCYIEYQKEKEKATTYDDLLSDIRKIKEIVDKY